VAPGLSSSRTIESRQEESTHLNLLGHNRPYASVRQSVGVLAARREPRTISISMLILVVILAILGDRLRLIRRDTRLPRAVSSASSTCAFLAALATRNRALLPRMLRSRLIRARKVSAIYYPRNDPRFRSVLADTPLSLSLPLYLSTDRSSSRVANMRGVAELRALRDSESASFVNASVMRNAR
jgi:hypothetical protein